MNFASSPPANSTIIICDLEVRYVKNGDIIDPENLRRIYDVTKCLAGKSVVWGRAIGLSK